MSYRVLRGIAGLTLALSPLVLATTAEAAARTTCLCRSEDSKSFTDRGFLHHRWACDFHFGYMRGDAKNQRAKRPENQTCNDEEIVQWKVYKCLSEGCTYEYAQSTEKQNAGLKKIEKAPAKRNP